MNATVKDAGKRKGQSPRRQPFTDSQSLNELFGPDRRNRPHRLRRTVQFIFLGVCLWIGWRFIAFYESCLHSGHAAVPRPPGVEAFLPISALMSARFWLQTGIIHPVHPASLLIFGAVVVVSFLFKRSFCSWVCPFGWLSENLANLGRKLFRRNFAPPRWLDWPLRAIKYLLLAFFVDIIFFHMDLAGLGAFLDSPFNQIADIRLFQFFLYLSTTAIVVLAVLIVLSIFIRNFWCRYLCPYGALAALAGLISPMRIRRDVPSCIECGKCAKACPSRLPVNKLISVRSDECSLCLECVEACPVADTLGVSPVFSRRRVRPLVVAAVIGGIFLVAILFGKLSGHWQSSVTPQQTAQQIQMLAPPR